PQTDLSDIGFTRCRLRHGVGSVDMTPNDPLRHANTVPSNNVRSNTAP
ncbi:hypothetical protein HMPREF9607_00957, partial [Cutibacterium modestum HL044PA1]